MTIDASMSDGDRVDEMISQQVLLSEKCVNTVTIDIIDGIVVERMCSVETNETLPNQHPGKEQNRSNGNETKRHCCQLSYSGCSSI